MLALCPILGHDAPMAGTATDSHSYRLADHLLNGGLRDFVLTRRDAGASWQQIANDLRDATGGVVDLSRESIRVWFTTGGAAS